MKTKTRRAILAAVVAAAAAPASLAATAQRTAERRALLRIMRLAEEWAGAAVRDSPRIPPAGSVYRAFWDLARQGLGE